MYDIDEWQETTKPIAAIFKQHNMTAKYIPLQAYPIFPEDYLWKMPPKDIRTLIEYYGKIYRVKQPSISVPFSSKHEKVISTIEIHRPMKSKILCNMNTKYGKVEAKLLKLTLVSSPHVSPVLVTLKGKPLARFDMSNILMIDAEHYTPITFKNALPIDEAKDVIDALFKRPVMKRLFKLTRADAFPDLFWNPYY